MRTITIAVLLAGGTATAGPIARLGTGATYDTGVPGHVAAGLAASIGWRLDRFSAELDDSYFASDEGATGISGGMHRLGGTLRAALVTGDEVDGSRAHLDVAVDLGVRRAAFEPASAPAFDRHGRELGIGLVGDFGWVYVLRYVVATSDVPMTACRGCAIAPTSSTDHAIIFEATAGFEL